MRGYPQFSFWISIAADMIYLSHIVIIWEKYFPLVGTVLKKDTLTHQYKLSFIKLFYKGYYGMLPQALAEKLIIHSKRSVPRTKHGLIA